MQRPRLSVVTAFEDGSPLPRPPVVGLQQQEDVAISAAGIRVRGQDVSATVDPADLEVGDMIGKGACSVVRRAVFRKTLPVALKMINVGDERQRRQLVEEVRSYVHTDCSAIVKFYGACMMEGAVAIVLEFMDGGSLGNVLEQVGAVPEPVLANMTFQILWGLEYLKHEHRIHRDIKPQNILINGQGQVKLTDFGVSKELLGSVAVGKTFVGCFKYMAPERLQNLPHTYTSDIWSLGVVLYELALGRNPFSDSGVNGGGGDSYVDVVMSVVTDPVPSLPYLSPHNVPFTDSFFRFLTRCLDKNPELRSTPSQLFGQPWLRENGADSLSAATQNVKAWIDSQ